MSSLDGLNSYQMQRQKDRLIDTIIYYTGHITTVIVKFAAKILMSFVNEFIKSFKTIFHL